MYLLTHVHEMPGLKPVISCQIHHLTKVYGIQHPMFGTRSIMNLLANVHEMPGLKPGISCQIHLLNLVQ